MIFVPNRDGISNIEAGFTSEGQCTAARVLLQTAPRRDETLPQAAQEHDPLGGD